MAKRMMNQPGLVEEFMKIVDSHGGEDCRNWANVARTLLSACNYPVKSPQKLKRMYYKTLLSYEIFKQPKHDLNVHQFSQLLQIDIKSRGNHTTATRDMFSRTGLKMSLWRFKEYAVLGVRNSLKVLVKVLGVQKKQIQALLSKFSYTSIQIMFRAADSKNQQDPLILDIQKYAILLEEAFMVYSQNHTSSPAELYDKLKLVMNRRTFRRCMFYLLFINELKAISLQQIKNDEELTNHPLLMKTIEENRQLPFYKRIVQLCDKEHMYQMYNTYNNVDDEQFKLYMHDKAQRGPRHLQPKLVKQNEILKTIRGKIHQPGVKIFRGWKTIIFHPEDEIKPTSEKSKQNELKQEKKMQKMQELYQIAFGEDEDNI